jgi:DNA-binding NtrC family response regulator
MLPEDDASPIITEILTTGDRLVLRTRMLRLDVVGGPCAGQTIEVAGPEVRVGSGKGMEMLLVDSTVSRHHVTLRLERSGVRVLDAQSRNGTVLDGVRVVEAFARRESVLHIGNSTLRIDLSAGSVDLPLSSRERFGSLLGKSMPMRRLFTVLERVAPTDETVLVEGETGTGKELAAEAIHEASPRAGGPLVVFDCSAVAANLVESELFGHTKGAFTGAVGDRIGAFEAADGGTLFLDELGELPIDMQPKLLRLLEKQEVKRVGSNQTHKVDVRVVAATNRNLAEEVAKGRFREDLFYRLAVVRIPVRPLRERAEDIPLLVRHFESQLAQRGGAKATVPPDVVAQMTTQAWPGNIRELRNAVARTLAIGAPSPSSATPRAAPRSPSSPGSDIRAEVDLSVPLIVARDRVVEEFERAYLEAALAESGGNVTRAAEIAGVNRKFIQRALARYRLRDPNRATGDE